MSSPTLIILAKPPRMGLSKTRLAKGLGRTEARRIARFTMARTMAAAQGSGLATRLYVEPATSRFETLGGLWPGHFERFAQASGDLGERLKQAMQAAPSGPVIFIGADAPGIRPWHIKAAAKALRRADAVFGPANDGGFWLLGISQALRKPDIFDGVRWSTLHAMEDVWSNFPAQTRVTLLPQLTDIDTAEDWKTHKKQ